MLFVIIIGFFAAGYFAAVEEWAFTWPFREIPFYEDNPELDKATKEKLAFQYHRNGAMTMGAVGVVAASSAFFIYDLHSLVGFWVAVYHFLSWLIAAGLVYANTFNIRYARKLKKDWFYLGETAEQDLWLTKKLGKDAGIFVLAISIVLLFIIIINN